MEIWDAYDKNSNKLGFDIIRGQKREADVYHLVVEALIRHEDGDYLLVQRAHDKEVFPSVFESSAGGSVLKGEDVDQAIRREVFEETGIDRINSIEKINRQVLSDRRTIFYTYVIETDFSKDQLVLDPEETIDYRWISKEEYISYTKSDENIPYQIERLTTYISQII